MNGLIEDYAYYHRKSISFNTIMSGCSVTVVVKRRNQLYVGSIGDTKAIIFRNQMTGGIKGKASYAQISIQHIPSDPVEKMRIYRNCGEIRKRQSDFSNKVFLRGRNYPGLHITRSIGD